MIEKNKTLKSNTDQSMYSIKEKKKKYIGQYPIHFSNSIQSIDDDNTTLSFFFLFLNVINATIGFLLFSHDLDHKNSFEYV